MIIPPHWPVAGICGYSGAGKTTLIERIIPLLAQDGLSVAVVKHDAHRLDVDRPGKDSDRFFRAGATVFAHDGNQSFLRIPKRDDHTLIRALELLLREHDLVLVEGHKHTALPFKIWLLCPTDNPPPPEGALFMAYLRPGPERFDSAHRILRDWLHQILLQAPQRAGILLGGQSTRMGRPKHLLEFEGCTWIERQVAVLSTIYDSVCLLGRGEIPTTLRGLPLLPDIPDKVGPLAGMIAAMRWDPSADWFFLGCDMPLITTKAIQWLLDRRTAGQWALMPRRSQTEQVEPLFAWYSHLAAGVLTQTDRPVALLNHPKTATFIIPEDLRSILSGFNTPEELAAHKRFRAR